MTIDPICRRRLPSELHWTLAVQKRSFGFCSETCRDRFLEAMERRRTQVAARSGTLMRGKPAKAEA
ncbi:MAG: hypothetical protein RL199_1792 [Pseudomonadota bacterium]|jgi:YHS domain-containing protein